MDTTPASSVAATVELFFGLMAIPRVGFGTADEMRRPCSERCVEAALDIQHGRVPRHVINRDVLESELTRRRQSELAQRFGT